jgi:hypothetical protein
VGAVVFQKLNRFERQPILGVNLSGDFPQPINYLRVQKLHQE